MSFSKNILVYFFCLFPSVVAVAQQIAYKPTTALQDALLSLSLPENTILEQVYYVTSPFAQHYTFQQVTDGKIVKHHGVKIHIYENGQINIQDFLCDLPVSDTYTAGKYLIPYEGMLQAAHKQEVAHDRHPLQQWVREDGFVLLEKDIHKYIKKDTSLFARVFMINPINSSGKPYGGNFVDANDQTNSSLDSQLVWRELDVKYDNDSFLLESEFLYFADISLPVDTQYFAIADSVWYTRDIDAFEFVNVYYHINTIGRYVNDLGYDALTDTLVVDVHAFNNWDNSAYTPSTHSLQFGEGGIDDAEDGEVVVHEFVHSLSELASPDNTIGNQREAMEEGSCDYFAKAYSRSINDNTPNKVFSWDGNETWSGIPINTNRKYPEDLRGSKDRDRDMWSSALMCVHDFIGREATDSLLLEHFYYQGPNTTMPQMAQIILDIDSISFAKRYHSQLKQCFVDAGFVQRGASIEQVLQNGKVKILNQQGFMSGVSPLQIQLPSEGLFEVYNISGQSLHSERGTVLTLKPENYSVGLYVVLVEIENTLYSFKIVR